MRAAVAVTAENSGEFLNQSQLTAPNVTCPVHILHCTHHIWPSIISGWRSGEPRSNNGAYIPRTVQVETVYVITAKDKARAKSEALNEQTTKISAAWI
jgi:hypothetical protein